MPPVAAGGAAAAFAGGTDALSSNGNRSSSGPFSTAVSRAAIAALVDFVRGAPEGVGEARAFPAATKRVMDAFREHSAPYGGRRLAADPAEQARRLRAVAGVAAEELRLFGYRPDGYGLALPCAAAPACGLVRAMPSSR